ncbi:MAG: hypothetical protein JWM05_2018 [Acidimicrobiales bacterium]|nr:hypothetical protein [Acidimicrobiales bacterium]
MDPLWFVPTAVLAAGAGAAWWLLRRIADTSEDVLVRARRLDRMQPVLVPVRTETDRARSAIDRLDHR